MDTVAASVRTSAFAPALVLAFAVNSVLRQTSSLVDAASLLELDVDGILAMVDRGGGHADSVPSQLWTIGEEQAAQLLLESLVEVEVDERVVDVGAFGKEGWENKTLRSHVPVLLMENEEEGHNCVRRPGNHKT